MNKVYTLLILTIVIAGAVGSSSKSQLESLLQAKSDFIPDRCEVNDGRSCEEDYFGNAQYPPACVCFKNGTCELRSDKSRCQWCNEEWAVSVNENQRCPDLNGGLLHVCPKKAEVFEVPELVICYFPAPEILIAEPEPAILIAEPEPAILIAEPEPAILVAEPEPAILVAEPEPAILVAEPKPTIGIAKPEPAILIAEPEPAISVAKPIKSVRPVLRPAPEPAILVADSVAKSSKLSPLVRPLPILPPVKVKQTKGCICTEDGVCTKAKSSDWKSECNDESVVAVVEDGACPKSAPIKYKAPADAYKCKKADRNTAKMCPMYISLYGCVCYRDGTCKNQGTNACTACISPDVVSVSSNSCAW